MAEAMGDPPEVGYVPLPGHLVIHPGMNASRFAVLVALVRAAREDPRQDGTCDPALVWLRETSRIGLDDALDGVGWLVEIGALDLVPDETLRNGRRFRMLWTPPLALPQDGVGHDRPPAL